MSVISCKRDEIDLPTLPILESDSIQSSWECKNTLYSLTKPQDFPPFPAPIQDIEMTEERIALGRKLFYETLLSGDNTMSCASCHNQGDAFSDNKKQFSTGISGVKGTKNSMALFNLAYSPAFFWDGRSATLQKQALEPVKDPVEMHETWNNAIVKLKGNREYNKLFYEAFCTEDYDSSHVARALTQFELTLISANSGFDIAVDIVENSREPAFESNQILNGYKIFIQDADEYGRGGDCFHCHSPDNMLFTNNAFMNNGLDDDPDYGLFAVTNDVLTYGQFKVPSLRNVEYSAPYMHDGRFETLMDVVEFYNSGVKINSRNLDPVMNGHPDIPGGGIAGGLNLTSEGKEALVAFLEALSDPDFLGNKDFSDPN